MIRIIVAVKSDREIHTLRRVGKRPEITDLNFISRQIGEQAKEKGIRVLDPMEVLG